MLGTISQRSGDLVNTHDVSGLSVDTFGEQVLLEDSVTGTVVTLSDDEAELLAKHITRAVEKVRVTKARRRKSDG